MAKETTYIWQDRRHFMWFPITLDKYWINNGRVYCQHGLLSQKEHECQLYRILDISMKRGLGNRIFGTGSIMMKTTDSSDPYLFLRNIKDCRAVKDLLSELVEKARNEKGATQQEIRATSGALDDSNGDGRVDMKDYL